MHLFKYLTKRELEKSMHCLRISSVKTKSHEMFSNWVKAEKFSDFERSGFLELSWWLWFPRFHGLIKCGKSWEDREVKRLRLKLCSQLSALAGDGDSLFFEVRNQGPDEPLGKLLQSGSIQSSKASRGDPLPSFISKLYSNHQMVASCEALWKSVYFSVSQAVLTLCSPGSLWRSLGLCWPSMGMAGWTSLPASFFPLCLLMNSSRNWRLI